jgi:hypothetical protein
MAEELDVDADEADGDDDDGDDDLTTADEAM